MEPRQIIGGPLDGTWVDWEEERSCAHVGPDLFAIYFFIDGAYRFQQFCVSADLERVEK